MKKSLLEILKIKIKKYNNKNKHNKDKNINKKSLDKCIITGNTENNSLLYLSNDFLDLDYENKLGICLCDDILNLYQSLYSDKNNTREQFL